MPDQNDTQNNKEVTTNEIMEFLKEHMVMREEFQDEIAFNRREFASIRAEIASIRKEMATKEDLEKLRTELRSELASKSDLGKLRSDLIDFIDKKFFTLTDILIKKGVVTPRDVQTVFGVEPKPYPA